MSVLQRKVVLVGMSPPLAKPQDPESAWTFPTFGLRRIEAALLGDPRFESVDLKVLDSPDCEPGDLAERLVAEKPDLVGFSAYIWSFTQFLETARIVKRRLPRCTLIFGGPSADPAMCELPTHAHSREVVDALVMGEGEVALQEIVQLPDFEPASLATIHGLALPTDSGWRSTPARPLNTRLDDLPSPNQMGLVPTQGVGYLETFRGCPLSCSFCEWGVMGNGAFFSEDYLTRELAALATTPQRTVFLLDAALNLNKRAFRNLAAAERNTGYFRDHDLICLLYPSLLDDDHLEFLSGIRHVYPSVGLQSLDEEVLTAVDRRGRRRNLERVISALSQLRNTSQVSLELIVGLPTDKPETFRRSLEEVLALGCGLRVYHCLVLPRGLMTRSPAEHHVVFDETSLKLTSAAGWPEDDLRRECERLSELAEQLGGYCGEYWWYFPPQTATRTLAA